MSTSPQPTDSTATPEAPIALTPKAADQVRAIQDRENLAEQSLRISIVGGGCSGMSYRMGFVDTTSDHDQRFVLEGVNVVLDPKSLLYLQGTTVDFTDGLNGSGFTFTNPNAKRTCGCGSSFSA